MLTTQIDCKIRQRGQYMNTYSAYCLASPSIVLSILNIVRLRLHVWLCWRGLLRFYDEGWLQLLSTLEVFTSREAEHPRTNFTIFQGFFVRESSLLFAERAHCHQEEAWIDHERCVGHNVGGGGAQQLHLLLQHGLGRPLTWHTIVEIRGVNEILWLCSQSLETDTNKAYSLLKAQTSS